MLMNFLLFVRILLSQLYYLLIVLSTNVLLSSVVSFVLHIVVFIRLSVSFSSLVLLLCVCMLYCKTRIKNRITKNSTENQSNNNNNNKNRFYIRLKLATRCNPSNKPEVCRCRGSLTVSENACGNKHRFGQFGPGTGDFRVHEMGAFTAARPHYINTPRSSVTGQLLS